MTQYFVDSSALVKRYMRESGSDWMRSIADSQSGHNILIAHITSIEIMSGIMRRKREGEIPEQTANALRQLLEIHVNRDYTVIRLTDSIVQRAKDLLEVHPLRAYDAVQLASAIEVNIRLIHNNLDVLTFVSADTRLFEVARAESLLTQDPNLYP